MAVGSSVKLRLNSHHHSFALRDVTSSFITFRLYQSIAENVLHKNRPNNDKADQCDAYPSTATKVDLQPHSHPTNRSTLLFGQSRRAGLAFLCGFGYIFS